MFIPYFVIVDDVRVSSSKTSNANDDFNQINCLLGDVENGTDFGIDEESKPSHKEKPKVDSATNETKEDDGGGGSDTSVFTENESVSKLEAPKLLRGVKKREKMCKNNTELIVLVMSKFDEYNDRNIVRQTWAQRNASQPITVLFVVGVDQRYYADDSKRNVSAYIAEKKSLKDEFNKHDDVLLIDVLEEFHNLSLKSYGAFDIVDRRCGNVQCIVKADSDTVLHLQILLKICRESRGFMFCLVS